MYSGGFFYDTIMHFLRKRTRESVINENNGIYSKIKNNQVFFIISDSNIKNGE